jgi:hypothetical protein
MPKILLTVLFGLLLTGCANIPPRTKVAAVSKAEATSELECMVDCLEDLRETCEACADRCLRTDDGPQVASLK